MGERQRERQGINEKRSSKHTHRQQHKHDSQRTRITKQIRKICRYKFELLSLLPISVSAQSIVTLAAFPQVFYTFNLFVIKLYLIRFLFVTENLKYSYVFLCGNTMICVALLFVPVASAAYFFYYHIDRRRAQIYFVEETKRK